MLRVASALVVLAVVSLALPPRARARVAPCVTGATFEGTQLSSMVQMPKSSAASDSTLQALFASGQAFPEFLEATRRRREGWHRITDSVAIEDSLVTRANAVGGSWQLLIIAIDACGDSMQQVPYVARLGALVDSLDVRIVLPTAGAPIQETHRSLDGRKATPTFVLLDASGGEAGCMVELPREIREWTHARLDSLSSDERYAYRAEWYAADKGASVVREVIELMERARSGSPMCERGQDTSSPS